MASNEKVIRVKRVRLVADQLVIEPGQIVIKRPKKKKDEEDVLLVREEDLKH
jgi:hypothetical protein